MGITEFVFLAPIYRAIYLLSPKRQKKGNGASNDILARATQYPLYLPQR